MRKVITYGTFDLLHRGHIRLLERARALGDYLVVGVTSDDFDKQRGKINVQQSLMERTEAVRACGLADEIIVEEYEGQKIDDIQRMGIDVFTVGSDWVGKFDYLREYCEVVYLDRTEGISSSELRAEREHVRMGFAGSVAHLQKCLREAAFVNGIEVAGVCIPPGEERPGELAGDYLLTSDYDELLDRCDAVFLATHPGEHATQIRRALERGVHVLCEPPVTVTLADHDELTGLADAKGLVLADAQKTAFSTAYGRLLLLVKSGAIGEVVSVDATCTSLEELERNGSDPEGLHWSSIHAWGPTALLPIFQLLGCDYTSCSIVTRPFEARPSYDAYTKVDFVFPQAVASARFGKGAKAEGELVITGTRGYAYVPAPWWKTDYFELRFENQADNRRSYYQLDGEGIRYAMVSFARSVEGGAVMRSGVSSEVERAITSVIENHACGRGVLTLAPVRTKEG